MELNKVYNENCLDTMSRMEQESIDLVITSPPYDNIRDYKGFDFDYKSIISNLKRVIKPGGVVVWVVADATIDGSETLTSFRQALYFQYVGFRVHDTMIYAKNNPAPKNHNRYESAFEYMFVFSNGKPKTWNPIKIKSKHAGKKIRGSYRNGGKDDLERAHGYGKEVKRTKLKTNIWYYNVGGSSSSKDNIAYKHPAVFPEQLVRDHLITWSNKGDVVYDPFMGSGTTAKVAYLMDRNWIGSEVSKEYCDLINKRLNAVIEQRRLF